MLTIGYHINISNEDLMNDLFAYRIQIMDNSIDEHFIIRKLKFRLIDMGYLEENLNIIIYSFYNYFDIPITLNEIENIQVHQPLHFHFTHNNNFLPLFSFFSHLSTMPNNYSAVNELNLEPILEEQDNQDNNHQDNHQDYNPLDNNFDIGSILNIILGGNPNIVQYQQVLINSPSNQSFMEDVLVTTDENIINGLNVLKITKDMDEKCAICIEEINENEEYFDITCKHIFHTECLTTYLKNYNHICPVCRNDIGNSRAHT